MLKQTLTLVGLSVLSLSANSALYDRGNGMIYDDTLDITWLQDANYAQTSGYDVDGLMTWAEANVWAAQLEYGGYDDWRLPSANLMNSTDICFSVGGSCDRGYNNTVSELGHMYYNNLGNFGHYDTNGALNESGRLINTSFIDGDSGANVSFLNLYGQFSRSSYWLGEEAVPSLIDQQLGLHGNEAWVLVTDGGQLTLNKDDLAYSWAVRDGDVSQVPVPAAAWLFGSALVGLAGVQRKR